MQDEDIKAPDPHELAEEMYQKSSVGTVYKKSISFHGKGAPIRIDNLFNKLVTEYVKGKHNIDERPGIEYIEAFNESFYKIALEHYKRKNAKSVAKTTAFGDNVAYDKLHPVIDVKTGERGLMNPDTKELSMINYDVWAQCIPKEMRGRILEDFRINGLFVYDPHTLERNKLIDWEGLGQVLQINTHIPPKWRMDPMSPDEIAELECPEYVDRLLKHLVPDERCRQHLMSWMYYALAYKSETYLVMNGAKGIGKGVFANLLRALVGKEHYTEGQRGFLESQFNSLLMNRRMVVLDEMRVDSAEKVNKLKSYINKYQNIEQKHKDANALVQIYTSFMISNNASADMHIECDDRRFSVMDLTDKDLTESMSLAEISEFQDLLENDIEYQRQVGNWVFHYCDLKGFDAWTVWKGQRYEELVFQSLPEWGKFLVDLLKDNPGKRFTHKDLAKRYRKETGDFRSSMAGRPKIEDLLTNLRIEGEEVGYTIKDKDGWAVIADGEEEAPEDDLLAPEDETEEDDEELLL